MDRTERFYKIQRLLTERRIVPRDVFLENLSVSRATFKRDLDGVELTEDERLAMIAAAKMTFQAVADLSDELMEPVGVS